MVEGKSAREHDGFQRAEDFESLKGDGLHTTIGNCLWALR